MRLNNFKQYEPIGENYIENVQFFISDEGVDFYDSFEQFKLKYKVGFDKDGLIRTISEDASAIYPLGLSVVDIDVLPDDFDIDGRWLYTGGKIKMYEPTQEELVFLANQQKQLLLSEATKIIAPLQDGVDLDAATDEEVMQLTKWKKYRVELNRVDTSSGNNVNWPKKP